MKSYRKTYEYSKDIENEKHTFVIELTEDEKLNLWRDLAELYAESRHVEFDNSVGDYTRQRAREVQKTIFDIEMLLSP